ncbi:urease accessory protein UreF [Carbonactinospora thermoautotrophica]|uniref:urease accessory protein UreF n=1 Tax=Carbonactinospora thermoautotrophica TaxID=1469144 RepID=UPI00226E1FF4|nr:urease accessory UreF family protein [Carbonactinospora thermoautotrophica]MCX9193466.1 urease accessory protein UreF [Carbonactinospora thermoautotrophica]
MTGTTRPPDHPRTAALLLLADSRLPAGGHVHSGGLEAAVRAGLVTDLASLAGFLRGRLATVGRVSAAFAAAAVRLAGDPDTGAAAWAELDAELDSRTPALPQRQASRAQGRSLLRIASAVHGPHTLSALREGCGEAPHQAIAFGALAAQESVPPQAAAAAMALASVTGPASAAVRLLALDPVRVHALLARLAPEADAIAAAAASPCPPAALPDASAPLLDILAEHHTAQEGRLFAS